LVSWVYLHYRACEIIFFIEGRPINLQLSRHDHMEVNMIELNRAATASFEVDPQRGFTLLCPDELPVADGHLITDELNRQANFAQYRIVSKDCHPAEAPWVAEKPEEKMSPVEGNYPGLDVKWPAHCIVGTEGNRLLPGLPEEEAYDLVIEKGRDPLNHPYGACYDDLAEMRSTGAIEWLQKHRISTVLVGGLATDYCVKQTVLQLCKVRFRVIVNFQACRGISEETCAQALADMETAGAEIINSCADLILL
jgi:nicotinamidase/pyrazinamidase